MVVRNGRVVLVIGGSGGPRIITSTLEVLLRVLDFGDQLGSAIALPRLHHQLEPNVLTMEALESHCKPVNRSEPQPPFAKLWTGVCKYLESIGHEWNPEIGDKNGLAETVGCVQAVFRPRAGLPLFGSLSREGNNGSMTNDGTIFAASDPRKLGVAAAS